MAAKPTATPRWANVGGDIVEPTSPKKDVGWVAEEKPPAQYFNWLLNLTYQWLLYLNDGIFDGNVQFLDNVDIDGTLNVDGTLLVTGNLTVNGEIKHGERVLTLPLLFQPFTDVGAPASYRTPDVAGVLTTGRAYLASYNGDSQRIAIDIPLHIGDRIKSVAAKVSSNEGGRAVDMAVFKHTLSGAFATYTVAQIGSTQTTGSSANIQTLTESGLTETIAADTTYTVQFEIDGGGGSQRVFAVYVTYDRP